MNKSEQELKEDEADALADLRQAVKDEVSDEWLLGFVRQYPFRTRSTALNLSHEQLSKIAEDLGLPSAHVVDCVMRQAILAASQPEQGVGLTEVLREAIDYLAAYCGEEGHCQPVIERGRAILARQPAPTLDSAPQGKPNTWTCFHCGESFADRESAALHFGSTERQEPICGVSQQRYREMELRMEAYNAEDAEIHREMHRQSHEHQSALRRAEEEGYARGLRDAIRFPEDAPQQPAAERAAVPEGWRLVPVEPTDEMIEAGDECWQMTSGNAAGYYRAMLAAAPSPAPVAQEGEALDNK